MTLDIVDNSTKKPATAPIAVAMAADTGYLLPTLVAIDSLLTSIDPKRNVDLYLITSHEDAPLFEEPVNQVLAYHRTGSLHFLSVDSQFDEASLSIPHITSATYYRLALPELLPNVDRCLYLDGDIVVCDDVSPIIDSLTDQDLVSGVKAAAYYWPEGNKEAHRRRLDIPRFTDYFNAGVLAMNLKLMRELGCSSVFRSLLHVGYASQDQDILNKACYGRTRALPPRFNLMTKYHPDQKNSFNENPCLGECYSEEEWQEALRNPAIVHFADRLKPWQTTQMDLIALWWKAASNAAAHCDAIKTMLPFVRRTSLILDERKRIADEKNAECDSLRDELRTVRAEKESLAKERNALASERNQLASKCTVLTRKSNKLRSSLTRCREKNEALKIRLDKSKCRLEAANETIERLHASKSWKIGRTLTAPARRAKALLKRGDVKR